MPTTRLRATRATALVAAAILASSGVSLAVAATVPSVFGGRVRCVAQSGVQFCAGSIAGRVESWDGVPVDVNLTLPAADGTQTLVSHDLYRPRLDRGRDVFQLHPNGWHFAAGHVPKLELLGQSAPYGRASNGSFTVVVERLELRLPVHEAPDGDVIAAPLPHVLPAPEAKGRAARACRLAGGDGACPTVGTVRGERG